MLLRRVNVVAVNMTTMIVTPERGLLLLPTTPAIYPATAAKRKPAVKIIIKDKMAGSNNPEISHTMKNIGIPIAKLVIATG